MLCGRNNWNETISTVLTKEHDGNDDQHERHNCHECGSVVAWAEVQPFENRRQQQLGYAHGNGFDNEEPWAKGEHRRNARLADAEHEEYPEEYLETVQLGRNDAGA